MAMGMLRDERNGWKKLAQNQQKKLEDIKKVNIVLKQRLQSETKERKRMSRRCKTWRMKYTACRKEKVKLERRMKYRRSSHRKKVDGGAVLSNDDESDDKNVLETKRNGEYINDVRFCVMELVGLEVATGKVGKVMRSVGELCGVEMEDVPGKTACQSIVDEGHVLAKKYIKEKVLKRCSSFGVHKDGTMRKKRKILDTSIHTDGGEKFGLGWTTVVAETGEAIADDVKNKLEEVVGGVDDDKVEMLKKLNYVMNDRAANEKKSTRLIDEWRDEVLKEGNCSIDDNTLHHLFCSAHVLFAFHSYALAEVREMPQFKNNDGKHPVTTLLKDASDLFGPVGDYRGVRTQWEGFCNEKNIKSTIKNFKDNRFNGLFEVAAQVYHHHLDFCHMLDSLSSKNTRQARLAKSLHEPNLIILLECLGIFFFKVTGPFWALVISRSSFQVFSQKVRLLVPALEHCVANPAVIFKDEFAFLDHPPSSSVDACHSLSSAPKIELSAIISTISQGLLKAVKAQLGDFLEGGKYETAERAASIPSSAPLTNLVSERHFGHLDSSQKRRPSSSLHHHSTVLLLKQTGPLLKSYFMNLSNKERQQLWKDARQQGQRLRQKHIGQDKEAIQQSFHRLKLIPRPSTPTVTLKRGQWIAVACEDAWYPAMVRDDSNGNEDVKVGFGEHGKMIGSFRYVDGKDVHTISRRSILETEMEVEPRAGGRIWVVKNVNVIQAKFSC